MENRFISRYKEGLTPWVHDRIDPNFIDAISSIKVETGKALDLGCGMGVEAIWLAQNDFEVTAIDISDIAINAARSNAIKEKADVEFVCGDFLHDDNLNELYNLAIDRGFFHTFHTDEERDVVAKKISERLTKNGIWITLAGNADEPRKEVGPPILKLSEIVIATEPYFMVREAKATRMNKDAESALAWLVVFEKR